MSPELIPYASIGLVACAALATLLGLRRHSRRFMEEVQRFTVALGLRAEGPRFVGEIEQVPVRMMVRTISVRFEDDSPGVCQVTTIALPIVRAQRWVLFDRDERFKIRCRGWTRT